jgi:hypothetical protein
MEQVDRTYSIFQSTLWKDTLADGYIPATGVTTGIVEKTAEDFKKKEKNSKKMELTEAN